MRNNGPVTQHEVLMPEGSMIVSRTDDKGRIQFVNEDFIAISGFTKDELIGQPHNLIRHPDMPPEAFEDMWRDLKAGMPWSGYVKNRIKNGDHYWVHANAIPMQENGQTVGYISIRSKPNAAITKTVGDIYQQFIEGKARGLSITHGRVINHNLKSRTQRWLSKLNNKVVLMGISLCCMIMITGAIGIAVSYQSNESLRTVYEDRTVPAGQLAEIEQRNYDSIVELYNVSTSREGADEVIRIVEENMQVSDKDWNAYMATYLTPEEKILADKYAEKRKEFSTQILLPALEMLKSGQLEEIGIQLVAHNALTDEIAELNEQLIKLQMDVAAQEYGNAKEGANIGLWVSLGIIVLGVMAALVAAKKVQKFLTSRLAYMDSCLNSIAGGNFNTDVAVGDDELQPTLTTVKALQAKLAYGEMEKKQLELEKHTAQQKLADDFEKSVKTIVNVVAAAATELSQTASSMVQTVMESSQKAVDASGAAATTTSNVQTVASAAEELSASVKEISGQLQKTTTLLSQSRDKAKNADTVANALSSATSRVTSAMEMISSIAGQINLLALNATIESARAGEAGKGFAVVASEVKNLAGQTDKTVNEIQGVVEEMRDASQAIISALSEIGISVGSISEAASSVASAVEEQSAVTNEIARNMQTAATGTQTISDNLQEVRASSSHAGSASEQMLSASQELSKQAENLNMEVNNFLRRVRAA